MNIVRRDFLSMIVKTAGVVSAVLAFPSVVWGKRNEKAFASEDLSEAINLRYPGLSIVDSTEIKMKAPAIAENGAVVPISVKTSLPNVKSISIFVANNPSKLSANFELSPLNVADVSIRVRMGKTSDVIALVESDGMLYRATQNVKVTIGGCGG